MKIVKNSKDTQMGLERTVLVSSACVEALPPRVPYYITDPGDRKWGIFRKLISFGAMILYNGMSRILVITDGRRRRSFMNVIWSKYIQGVKTLYYSRKLRFDDMFAEQYQALFQLDKTKNLKILEIGCGPGALVGALRRWYPGAEITAIDRDSNFISFAKEHEKGITFLEGIEKYDNRTVLYDRGVRQWDTSVSVIMAIRGMKKPVMEGGEAYAACKTKS